MSKEDKIKERRVYVAPTLDARRLEEVVRGEEGSVADNYGAGTRP